MDQDYNEGEAENSVVFVSNERVSTQNGRIGIFPRADRLDISPEDVESKTQEYDEIFNKFSEEMELKEPKPAIYYHNRFADKLAILEIGVAEIPESPVSSDLYFIVEYKEYGKDTPCFILRLNDRLGIEDESGSMSVWEYDKNRGTFSEERSVRSKINNERVYKNYLRYINNIDISKDPFIQVASSIHKL